MTVKDTASQILLSAGKPLHAKEIAHRVIKASLWRSEGKTPDDGTVSAQIYTDIKKNCDKSAFVKIGPQTFALRDSAEIPSGVGPVFATVNEVLIPSSANAVFSFADCAQKVLEVFGGKNPMHYKEIMGKVLGKGWLVTGRKTPEAIINA